MYSVLYSTINVAMDLYRKRRDCTAVINSPCGVMLNRRDVVSAIEAVVGRDKVVTLGQLDSLKWEIVLSDDTAMAKMMDSGTFSVKGVQVIVQGLRRQPMCIPEVLPHFA